MKCENCHKKTNVIHIGREHEKLCSICYKEKYRKIIREGILSKISIILNEI